jgi:hypothetical protein
MVRLAVIGVVLVAFAACARRAPPADAGPPPPTLDDVLPALQTELARRSRAHELARADGFVYAIDVALLAEVAARTRDRASYDTLRSLAEKHFILERPPGLPAPAVIWRRQLASPSPPDASGTTEAFALARALLLGGDTFRRGRDVALAVRILEGYAAHASFLDGIWLVRNYYNLGTRTFATNSFLIDYAPDLFFAVARRTGDERFHEIARRSLALVRAARRPGGLIDAVVQPELRTLFPTVVFSPNDVIELEHAALIANEIVENAPAMAADVLAFALARRDDLHAAYEGRSGHPYGWDKADAGTYAALTRLAVRLRDPIAVAQLRTPLAYHAQWLVNEGTRAPLHVTVQTLLGLLALRDWDETPVDAQVGSLTRAAPGQSAAP